MVEYPGHGLCCVGDPDSPCEQTKTRLTSSGYTYYHTKRTKDNPPLLSTTLKYGTT